MNFIPMAKRLAILVLVALAGCATLPSGPSVLVLPGSSKSFDQFRGDDVECRHYAFESIGGKTAAENAQVSGATTAVVGTAIGAVAGAALGGRQGAAVGAGVGLGVGAVAGVGAADRSMYGTQRRYDFAYQQCMYAKGHRVPVSGRFTPEAPRQVATPAQAPPAPPPPGTPPPPPPGAPPAPPSDAPPPPPPGVPPPPPPGVR